MNPNLIRPNNKQRSAQPRRYQPLTRQSPPPIKTPQARVKRREVKDGSPRVLTWAYGVTTFKPTQDEMKGGGIGPLRFRQGLPYRRLTTLPVALASLAHAGFACPTLFVDGETDPKDWEDEFGIPVVCRGRRIGAFGNWILGLAELMIRQPHADYYAMFQDDFVTSLNLRTYLETVVYPDRGYLNLYTFPRNQILSHGRTGFYPANQKGQGAVALVFDRETAVAVVSDPYIANRPKDRVRGHKFIDGGVVESMRTQGYTEYCHNPSLVQHLGLNSTLHNPKHALALSFRGETFDLMTLLEPVQNDGANDPARKTPTSSSEPSPTRTQGTGVWSVPIG